MFITARLAGLDDTPTWTATGEEDDMFGSSVGSAGDVNGDGYADIVVLARGYDGFRGKVYVYHGSAHGLDVPFSTFVGGDEGELNAGGISAVDTAGDVNGDGFADLVVGANGYMTSTGRIYIYQGSPLGLTPTFEPVAAGENSATSLVVLWVAPGTSMAMATPILLPAHMVTAVIGVRSTFTTATTAADDPP